MARESAPLIFSVAASRLPLKGNGAEYFPAFLSKCVPSFSCFKASRCSLEAPSKSSWPANSSENITLISSRMATSSTFAQLETASSLFFLFPLGPMMVQPKSVFIPIGSAWPPFLHSPPTNADACATPMTASTPPSMSSNGRSWRWG